VIDLADLVEHLKGLGVGGDTLASLVNLGWGFKQERLDLPFGEAAVEVKERAMLGPAGMAAASGLATLEESLDQRGVQDLRGELEGAQEMGLSLAQGQGGGALERLYLTHIYM